MGHATSSFCSETNYCPTLDVSQTTDKLKHELGSVRFSWLSFHAPSSAKDELRMHLFQPGSTTARVRLLQKQIWFIRGSPGEGGRDFEGAANPDHTVMMHCIMCSDKRLTGGIGCEQTSQK